MTLKEEREYLENELKSYRYIVNKIYEYQQIVEECQVAMEGTSSPRIKEVIYENAGDPKHCKYDDLNDKMENAYRKSLPWIERKAWVDERLSILDEIERKVIKYRYMLSVQATYEWIASVLFCHRNSVRSIKDDALEKMLKL